MGANADIANHRGDTPLMLLLRKAISKTTYFQGETVLNNSASVNPYPSWYFVGTIYKSLPIRFAANGFATKSYLNDEDIPYNLLWLLWQHTKEFAVSDKLGDTLLHHMIKAQCDYRHSDILLEFLRFLCQNPKIINARNSQGNTPLLQVQIV